MLSIIAAVDLNLGIGFKGKMLWTLPSELQYFKETTMGSTMLMGRKTFESVGNLPGRETIVISKSGTTLTAGLTMLDPLKESFIVGGASLYHQTIQLVDRIYLSVVDTFSDNIDTYFPEWNPEDWNQTSVSDRVTTDNFTYTKAVFDRK